MNILFVTTEYITEKRYDGGLSNYLFRLCGYLTHGENTISIVTLSDKDEEITFKGVHIYRVKPSTSAALLLKSLKLNRLSALTRVIETSYSLNRVVKSILEKEKIDIIQYSSYQSTGIFKPKSVPSIVRLSSYQPLIRLAQERKANYSDYLMEWIEKKTIASFDYVLSPSNYTLNHIKNDISSSVKMIESPYKIPETYEFDDSLYLNWLNRKRYILYFGALTPIKGVDLIAKELNQLLLDNPTMNIVFVGKDFGYKGQPMMDFIWDSAGSEKSRVLYLGKLNRAHLNSLIEYADIILLPSKTDNLPNTCIEAMGLGKVVVGPRGASFDQLIEHGTSGLLFEHNNAHSLRKTTQLALDMSMTEKKVMGRHAIKKIEKLDPAHKVPELLEFYKLAIKSYDKHSN